MLSRRRNSASVSPPKDIKTRDAGFFDADQVLGPQPRLFIIDLMINHDASQYSGVYHTLKEVSLIFVISA
jgi:hypothetical protein